MRNTEEFRKSSRRNPSLRLYRRFMGGLPHYLVRHYWWAYLWSKTVWFFDLQIIINAILFGQYKKLLRQTSERLANAPITSTLQLTCVYGILTPNLIEAVSPHSLHITDVSSIQLKLAQSKTVVPSDLTVTRMNAERLAYKDDAFTTVVIFFLLHELPPEARAKVLSECMRVTADGGSILISDYAPLPKHHLLYRFAPIRWLTTKLEPFLAGFWNEDIQARLNGVGRRYGKEVNTESDVRIFCGFYRVTEFKIKAAVPFLEKVSHS